MVAPVMADPAEATIRAFMRALPTPSSAAEERFVAQARDWAQANGVSPEAFLAEGVPADTLRRGGFALPPHGQSGAPSDTAAREQVIQAIPRHQPFTVRDLARRSGRPTAVVRRVIDEEVVAGRVTAVELARMEGRSRDDVLYRRTITPATQAND